MEGKALVAYFSASGVTKKVAQVLAGVVSADLYEIKPEVTYTQEDLNWKNKNSRSSIEMNDLKSRPALADKEADVDKHNVIFIGFPIWWYVAPHIINTFLESYDFSNKTIVLFATSGGSGFGKTVENLKVSVDDSTVIKEGKIFNETLSKDDAIAWTCSLGL
ncbi:Flavodoxin [Hathewaya proteolytica DSM 3090]|uniref:Flavodoxin n=1 Tax=Hathewaya proteolytica DSM 3090 TaxID=1121331 RepID=A0A1M6RD54_9CLOT|nr:flavodoxin [Hathewaya proteolytica]SHK30277.1 Flavodoxin [Hathewaya proteolytica DSM 3090]